MKNNFKWSLWKFLQLILCIAVPLGLGFIAGIVTSENIATWYETLEKPFFNPPNWLFAPVWITLYILMGISLFVFLQTENLKLRKENLIYFAVQQILNFAWSFSFFYFHNPLLALFNIFALLIAILLWLNHGRKINLYASLLQIPYILWVSFATALNLAIVLLN